MSLDSTRSKRTSPIARQLRHPAYFADIFDDYEIHPTALAGQRQITT
jgi:hypothetical protein